MKDALLELLQHSDIADLMAIRRTKENRGDARRPTHGFSGLTLFICSWSAFIMGGSTAVIVLRLLGGVSVNHDNDGINEYLAQDAANTNVSSQPSDQRQDKGGQPGEDPLAAVMQKVLKGFTEVTANRENKNCENNMSHVNNRTVGKVADKGVMSNRIEPVDDEDDDAELCVDFKNEEDKMSVPSDMEVEGPTAREERRRIEVQDAIRRGQSSETKAKHKVVQKEIKELLASLKRELAEPDAEIGVSEVVLKIRIFLTDVEGRFDTASGRVTAMIHCCNAVMEVGGLDMLQSAKDKAPRVVDDAQWVIEKLAPHIWPM